MSGQIEKLDSNKTAALGGLVLAFVVLAFIVRHLTK